MELWNEWPIQRKGSAHIYGMKYRVTIFQLNIPSSKWSSLCNKSNICFGFQQRKIPCYQYSHTRPNDYTITGKQSTYVHRPKKLQHKGGACFFCQERVKSHCFFISDGWSYFKSFWTLSWFIHKRCGVFVFPQFNLLGKLFRIAVKIEKKNFICTKIRRKNPKIVCSLAWRPGIFAYKSYSAKIGVGTRRERNIFKHTFLCVLDSIHEWLLSRITYYLLGISMILLHKDVISA